MTTSDQTSDCEEGVVIITIPNGKPTVTHLRSLAYKWLYGSIGLKRRFPHDGKESAYKVGELPKNK